MSKQTIGRRTTLGLMGAGLVAAPFIRPSYGQAAWPEQTTVPDILKGSGEVRIATFGGLMQEVQQKAYFEPFEKITGIKVRAFPGSDATKVKAMVETGNVEWDMAQLSRGSIMNLQKRGDYFEKIDYDIVDPGVEAQYRFEYGLEMLVWAQVLAYRTDAFKGAVPSGWADFWDTKKFPGDRAMFGTNSGGWPEMEFALMAAGVPADKLYPIDIDKALASYSKIKKDVFKWWGHRRGAHPASDRSRSHDDHGVEWPNGGTAGRRRARFGQLESRSAEARRVGHSQGREEQDQRHEIRGLLDHGDPPGSSLPRHSLWVGERQVERIHSDGTSVRPAERPGHQEAARQLQLRLVDRQSRGRHSQVQQVAVELTP
jgi:hypothetical protein